jgi:hypothetical protein
LYCSSDLWKDIVTCLRPPFFVLWGEFIDTMPTGRSSPFDRRRFLSMLASLGGLAAASRTFAYGSEFSSPLGSATVPAETVARQLARYPQKTDLILLTDRPPQLETPLHYFRSDLTPNSAFFVRWHVSLNTHHS